MPTDEKFLGEFEQIILLSILRSDNQSYGVEIAETIESRGNRSVSLGALYTTLTRLESKGLVNARMGEATATRGGRAKKYFSVTVQGQTSLKRSLELLQNMSEGIVFSRSSRLEEF